MLKRFTATIRWLIAKLADTPVVQKHFTQLPAWQPPTKDQRLLSQRRERLQRVRRCDDRESDLASRIMSPGRLKRLNELNLKCTLGTHHVRRDRRKLVGPVP